MKILMQAKDKGKRVEADVAPKERESISTPTEQKKQTIWADLAEEEERAMGVAEVPASWAEIARSN